MVAEADQKIENLLNLSLQATQGEREKSENLEEGYNAGARTWEVIVRHSGTLAGAVPEDWTVVQLSGGYAIVTLPQEGIEALAALPQVEYVEMPKRLYFAAEAGRTASCVSAVQTPRLALTGRGILVAVIDSGVDYFHPDFRNADGSTRIAAMWDQTAVVRERTTMQDQTAAMQDQTAVVQEQTTMQDRTAAMRDQTAALRGTAGRVPEGFRMGAEYTREEIDAALAVGDRAAGYEIVPERDVSGHGTQVLGIAAGNGRASGGSYRGMAPEAELIVVKLGIPRENDFPRTTELMQALEYVVRKAEELARPVAVNVSIGNVYGSHRGTSLLETYFERMADRGRNVLAVGTGNEGNTGGHAAGRLAQGVPQKVEFLVNDYETTLNIQIWKDYADEFEIALVHPDGRRVGLNANRGGSSASPAGSSGRRAGTTHERLGNTELLAYYGEPSPYQGRQEIYLDLLPTETYLDSGIWSILLSPVRVVTGEYQMWLNDARARGEGTRFLQPSPDATMTIPSTAARVVAVGAYDARSRSYAPFSGRGWARDTSAPKPDLVAPGVDVTTTAVGGGYVSVSGTSFATPFVTGAAALLMQWGIADGNDPYLYGEKLRAYLRRGARELPGFTRYPNNQVGYGALCVRDSIPS